MDYLPRSSAADERVEHDYEAIFGNDNGEDEDPRILAGYFVEQPSLRKAYDRTRRLEIIKARKGMGKSALLSHLKYRLVDDLQPIDRDAVVIKTTGNDLMGLADFSGKDPTLLENRWKQVICKRISMALAAQLGFAGSDDTISLVESAEIEGYKGRNLVSSLMTRLGTVVENASKALSGGTLALKTTPGTDAKALAYENILRRIQAAGERNVWLLIDDIDAKFIDTPEFQVRIGAFFSAIRALAFSVEGLRVRATVRTDVWTHLRSMEDQDKLRQYVMDIRWSDENLRSIFAKRILSHLQRDGDARFRGWHELPQYRQIVAQVFAGDFRIGADRQGDPLTLAILLAGRRPRWMGQLCKLAGAAAGSGWIEQRHFNAVMGAFGREKISDLIKEHQHQFAELQKLIDAFRGSERALNRFKLLAVIERGFVQRLGPQNVPAVNGFPFQTPDQLAELLYEIDFIVGDKAGRPTPYHDDPTLFASEANQQNRIAWTVNLSYRSFLGIG